MKKVTLLPLAALTLAASTLANAQSTLVIDSWRSDDAVWNEKLSQPSTSTTRTSKWNIALHQIGMLQSGTARWRTVSTKALPVI